jgi:DnaJ-class molecular chaperone
MPVTRRRTRLPCPTCATTKLQACPACGGTGKAVCHRCQNAVYIGDWVSRESFKMPGGADIHTVICVACAREIGVTIGPRIRRVA